MLRHLSTNLCDQILRDNDGRISMIGTFMNLRAKSFPTNKNMGVVVAFRADVGDEWEVAIVAPDDTDQVISSGVVDKAHKTEHQNQLWAVTAAGVLEVGFMKPAVYRVVLRIKGAAEPVHVYDFGVFPAQKGDDDDG